MNALDVVVIGYALSFAVGAVMALEATGDEVDLSSRIATIAIVTLLGPLIVVPALWIACEWTVRRMAARYRATYVAKLPAAKARQIGGGP